MTYNVNDVHKRYMAVLENDPTFFLQPDCSIIKLAQAMGISRNHASQFVNKDMKTTFHKLVRTAKLRKMESLLIANPDKDINELIHEAGFKCDISFRRAYMEKYGELPSKSLYRLFGGTFRPMRSEQSLKPLNS